MATMAVCVGPASGLLRAGGLVELLAEGVSGSAWAGGLAELLADGVLSTIPASSASAAGPSSAAVAGGFFNNLPAASATCSAMVADLKSRGFFTNLATGSDVIPFAGRSSFGAAALHFSSRVSSTDLYEFLNRGFLSHLLSGSDGFSMSAATTQLAARASSCFSLTETVSSSRTSWSCLGLGATFALVYMTGKAGEDTSSSAAGGGGAGGGGGGGYQQKGPNDRKKLPKDVNEYLDCILRKVLELEVKLDRVRADKKWTVVVLQTFISEKKTKAVVDVFTICGDVYGAVTKWIVVGAAIIPWASLKLTPAEAKLLAERWLNRKKKEAEDELKAIKKTRKDDSQGGDGGPPAAAAKGQEGPPAAAAKGQGGPPAAAAKGEGGNSTR